MIAYSEATLAALRHQARRPPAPRQKSVWQAARFAVVSSCVACLVCWTATHLTIAATERRPLSISTSAEKVLQVSAAMCSIVNSDETRAVLQILEGR